MVATTAAPIFTSHNADIRSFNIKRIPGEKANDKPRFEVSIDGRKVQPTKRFWSSLTSRYSTYGVSMNLFKSGMFAPEEIFERLAGVVKDGNVRYTLQENANGDPKLLAVAGPASTIIRYEDAYSLLNGYGGEDTNVTYLDGDDVDNLGVIRSTHTPKRLDNFKVSGDEFMHKFTFEVPIDGYGKPKVFLSLLRLVCSNGMVGIAPAFTSEISPGRGEGDYLYTIRRALEAFNNDDGFSAMRDRMEMATRSWASVAEAMDTYKVLVTNLSAHFHNKGTGTLCNGKADATTVLKAWHDLTGDIAHIYGVANMDSLSRKRQERLPAKCTVYDIINFTTEVATHYIDPASSRRLYGHIGQMIGNTEEFDLQDSMTERPEFADFFIANDARTLAGTNDASLIDPNLN